MFNLAKIRDDFPILKRQINGKALVYLDNAATTQKPHSVIQALTQYYEGYNANIHRASHGLANEATTAYEGTRELAAAFVGASHSKEIVFTRNTTESINLVAQSWGREHLNAGDEILISEAEHHANWVPWAMIAKERGAQLKYLPLSDDGRVDLERGKNLFSAKTKMVAVSWVSNVLGIINPVKEIVALAKQVGAKVLLDAAQAAPHFALNLKDSGADFAAFSAHKMLGPTGVGVLWGKESVLESMRPYQGGGTMIETVSKENISFNRIPWRFEAGTPNIADVIAFAEAIKYLQALGWDAIQAHDRELSSAMLKHFSSMPGLRLYGGTRAEDRVSVFSFNLEGSNSQDIGALLDSMGFALRVGNHCAQPLMARFACPGMARASFYIYNSLDEVDAFAKALARVQKMLGNEVVKK
jgi:cysteine desulfurase/selenocysteine lyase